MEWEPEEHAFLLYIKMELRYYEIDQARQKYQKLVTIHLEVKVLCLAEINSSAISCLGNM